MLAKIINRLRNGYMVYQFGVSFKEVRFCTNVLDILWKENLIKGYTKTNEGFITVLLRYYNGSPVCTRLVVISRPRDRIYLSLLDISRLSNNFGVLILSTTKGIMTNEHCIRKGEGGEVLAYVV
uniref:ribosomal protein S8 n=1 Tax=Ecklonia cava TaxID=105407 RepID=UPI002E76D71D|nr:ribosomal protein S8 [Ecklonia cava]WBP69974.1 ribosomal protein S8 [Ecklonia cava]WBP70009.1 ribosomal protein S8 [Ecklonia cava subsp. stolonifera]